MRIFVVTATLLLSITPLAKADTSSISSLLSSSGNLASSLVSTFPIPSIALLPAPYWWWESANAIDALITYSQTAQDSRYTALLQNTILSQTTGTNDFMTASATGNDDQAWWALAALTAAENGLPNMGGVSWLDLARNVFNEQAARWDASTCGGGMKWQIQQSSKGWHYKNSITNGLFFQLAARLARFTGDANARAWAESTYDWVTSVGLIGPNFEVYDGTNDDTGCTSKNIDQWSYNNAVFLYGSAIMAATTGEQKWLDRTNGFIAAAGRTFVNPQTGALFEQKCEAAGTCNTDQVSFKGILARWLGAAATALPAVQGNVAAVVNGAATGVQSGGTTGLGAMGSLIGLEVVVASLRAQGVYGGAGLIGLSKSALSRKRSVAGRISW
ncbi:hydrolase 76 protein [Neocucurbitaria cava]|uniref:mannan endo-1,6-alpha-mannosidase n=1 Tax=Neocucurbitaria cava TaxID=798079 RepID=A0A9W9CIM1_9PLEO|nr:hydrolase 76 protein [Neocucurbitaria cava]